MKKVLTTLTALAFGMTSMAQHTFFYDTYDLDNTAMKVQVDSYTLQTCTDYSIMVDGTYSIWASNKWGSSCGSPEPAPIHLSAAAGAGAGTVGFDPEYIYAINSSTHSWCSTLPVATTRIEMSLDNGGSWIHPLPDVPGYNAFHTYTYTVTGQGFPIQIRHVSPYNSDDYGQLRYAIDPILMDPCDFEPNFKKQQNNCSITFGDASAIPCSPGFSIIGQSWDFGDGFTSSATAPVHAYANSGAYEVTYTVWVTNGEQCCKQVIKKRINAEACDPCEEVLGAVNFDFSLDGNTLVGTEVGINGLSTGDLQIGYVWDFGDGNTATGANATHTYSGGGDYIVCLTVFYSNSETGECCSETKCLDVSIKGESAKGPTKGGLRSASTIASTVELAIYPNPSNGVVNISTKDDYIDRVSIYDNSGRVVFTLQNKGETTFEMDLTKLTAGYYVVIGEGLSGKIYKSKIIIE